MSTSDQEKCPYSVGQRVIYQPSQRGKDFDVMSSASDRLIPGNEYQIESIQNGIYVLVMGNKHPGGGIYWTEFKER